MKAYKNSTTIRLLYKAPQLINVLHKLHMGRPIFIKAQFYDLVCFMPIDSMFVSNLEPVGSSNRMNGIKYWFSENDKRPMP